MAVDDNNSVELEQVLKNTSVDLKQFYFIKLIENHNNTFKIRVYNLDLEQLNSVGIVLIHKETKLQKVFSCTVINKSYMEFTIDNSVFSSLKNPYELQKWFVAIAHVQQGSVNIGLLKEKKNNDVLRKLFCKKKLDIEERNYNIDINLYGGKYKKNSSRLDLEEHIIEVTPIFYGDGFFTICTMSKILHLYRNGEYGIRSVYILENGFRIYANLPEYFYGIKKIYVISKKARKIEIGNYQVDYKILKQQKESMDIQIDIDLRDVYYYAAQWSVEIFLQYEGRFYRCPLLSAGKKVSSVYFNERTYRNEPVEMEFMLRKNGSFSFVCRMDLIYEKSFILRYAQLIEEKELDSIENLVKKKKLKILGSINAEWEVIDENRLTIQLANETLVRCEEILFFLIGKNEFNMVMPKIVYVSHTKGAIIISYPQLIDTFLENTNDWKMCLAVRRQGLYYVLELEKRNQKRKERKNALPVFF